MCERINAYAEMFDEIRSRINFLTNEQSRLDIKVNEIYHEIEISTFNVVGGYKLSKILKDTLNERREVKNELEVLRKILSKAQSISQTIINMKKQQEYRRIGAVKKYNIVLQKVN